MPTAWHGIGERGVLEGLCDRRHAPVGAVHDGDIFGRQFAIAGHIEQLPE